MVREISRRTEHDDANLSQTTNLERRVGQISDAHSDIEIVIEEVCLAIRGLQLHLDARVLLHEIAYGGCHIGRSELDRRADAYET